MKSKAFFVNGGYGRVVSSIPAFELYAKESGDEDFVIICEGGTDAFKGHPDLDHRAYDNWHKNLFKEKKLIFLSKISNSDKSINSEKTLYLNEWTLGLKRL
mgnify:CR=1 FL=1